MIAIMKRFSLIMLLAGAGVLSYGQTQRISLGVFTGFTSSVTWDRGINIDSRYQARYDLKWAPIGFNFGVDYQGFGIIATPSLINIGQNYYVINNVGGHEGIRKINMRYAMLPVAVKLHIIDLSFFQVSLIGGAGPGYLVDGRETITHHYGKYRFPQEVYPVLPPDYIVEYDGVLAPETDHLSIVKKADFNSLQIFVSGGFRSDWDVAENWRLSLDVQGYYGIRESRGKDFLNRAANHELMYTNAGSRRDMFAFINVGISRSVDIDVKKENATKSERRFTPKKNPFKKGKHRGR